MTQTDTGGIASWQRPPFPPGNQVATQHGAYSTTVDLRAEELVAALLDDPGCPPHLHEPRFRHSLMAWGRAETRVERLSGYADALEVDAALTEASEITEEATYQKGSSRKRTSSRRMESASTALERWERRAQSLRNDLLITPAAAARARLEPAKYDSALHVQALIEHDQKEAASEG